MQERWGWLRSWRGLQTARLTSDNWFNATLLSTIIGGKRGEERRGDFLKKGGTGREHGTEGTGMQKDKIDRYTVDT